MKIASKMIRHSSAFEESQREMDMNLSRKVSEGAVERITRNGSVVSLDFDTETPSDATKRKTALIEALKKEVR